ncbi:DUF1715-domain-containing protein [Ascobolus immersus RN42]|uniref:DUF1715-domain-containing protein n=1 Tax=Ascobolus immersus RN42 TaxID=1160509 RepID=A0A3N4IAB1_ASCIM|nr:DUF1715-domain-containing protein [Ascobolus immersus RN42]
MTSNDLENDFDTLLTLEESFYNQGYAEGLRDGQQQGHTEGRLFGLAKGFEKFALLGQIHGRASVWQARAALASSESTSKVALPNPRLTKHLASLLEMLETVEVRNGDEEVAQMEDARKRVLGKVRGLESILKEKGLEGVEVKREGGEAGIEEAREVPGRG